MYIYFAAYIVEVKCEKMEENIFNLCSQQKEE